MEYSKEVKKLLNAIKDKQEQNRQSEKKTNLEDVTKRQKKIEQKIKILKRHLEQQENYRKNCKRILMN